MFVYFAGRGGDKKKLRSCQCRRGLLCHHPWSWRKKSKERRNRERLRSCCAGFTPVSREWASPFFIRDSELPALGCHLQTWSKNSWLCRIFYFFKDLLIAGKQGQKCLVRLGARNPEVPTPLGLCLKCIQLTFQLKLWRRHDSQDRWDHKGFCKSLIYQKIRRCTGGSGVIVVFPQRRK